MGISLSIEIYYCIRFIEPNAVNLQEIRVSHDDDNR